jgi:predicted nucleic acid-binding protein
VTLIVDAGALYAQADAADPAHAAVSAVLRAEREPIVTSELALAEADYLILDRLGVDVEIDFLTDLVEGTFAVECLTRADLGQARTLVQRHRDLELGLADASLVILAARHRTRRLLTLDQRAFRTVAPLQGGEFLVLPADAP